MSAAASPVIAALERQIDIERERWTRIRRSLGQDVGDPLSGFDPCDLCGQRGPTIPLWMRPPMTAAAALKLPRAEQLRLASTYVCADGCPDAGTKTEEEQTT